MATLGFGYASTQPTGILGAQIIRV